MAIYLDSNILYGWNTFAELDRLAISIVAGQTGQEIVIPALVVEEVEAHHRRALESALESFEQAGQALTRLFSLDYVHADPAPDVDNTTAAWRRRLDDMCEIAPMKGEDAALALSREVAGVAPAKPRVPKKPGAGARDAAIWLSIVRDHLAREEESHLITANTKDFLDGGEKLKPRLLEDLDGASQPLNVYSGTERFVSKLGVPSDEAAVEAEELRRRGLPAIEEGLRNSSAVPWELFDGDIEGRRHRIRVSDAQVLSIRRSRHYSRDDASVVLVDAEWSLVIDCLYQAADTAAPDEWFVLDDLRLHGGIQVYLPEGEGQSSSAQFIAAQLVADTRVEFMPDGSLAIWSEARNG